MTKHTDSQADHDGQSTSGSSLKKKTPCGDAPAAAAVIASNGAFPREGLGADTDDVDLRTRVYAHIRKYSKPSWGRALWELFHTFALYFLAFQHPDSWLAFVFVTLCRVRIFIIFHDCAHDAFFPSHAANQVMGLLLGTVNHTPLSFWSRGHNHHHRHRCVPTLAVQHARSCAIPCCGYSGSAVRRCGGLGTAPQWCCRAVIDAVTVQFRSCRFLGRTNEGLPPRGPYAAMPRHSFHTATPL